MKNLLIYTKRIPVINVLLATLLIITIILFIFSILNKNSPQIINNKKTITLKDNSKSISVEVELAKTNAEQEKGLMNRTNLDENSGMLFIFENNSQKSFWMKNTLINLDIAFFDQDGKLVNISENALPCKVSDNQCPLYNSYGAAKYVLEVNGGWFKKNDFKQPIFIDLSNI